MKNLLVLLFLVTFSMASSAQFNIKAGINLSNQTINTGLFLLDTKNKFGYFLGFNYEARIFESFGIRPGAQFISKGSKIKFSASDISSNYNYIELPFDFVYYTNKVSVHLGPYMGLLVSASSDGEDIREEIKTTDIGINLGAEYDLGRIGVGINYGLGLSNIGKENYYSSLKNKVINFFVTFEI